MLGILLLCGYLLCGGLIADCLFARKPGLIRIWLGLCLGLLLMMWLPAIFAFVIRFTRAAQLLGLACAAVPAAVLFWRGRKRLRSPEPFCGGIPFWLPIALIVPLAILSAYLQYTHVLRNVDGALHVGQSTYGDLCLHLGIATSLRNAAFPPHYSILPGALLGYPFLADSMVTSMLLLGTKLSAAYVLTGTLMMILVYTGFVIFAWELTHKKAAVILAFVLMFINGGLGFIYTFDGVFKDPTALYEAFTAFYKTPTNMTDRNLVWVNVIADMMIPQRTLLAGWTMLLPALYMLLDAARNRSLKRFLLLGAWAGLMPMVHTHSFFALGLLSAGVLFHQLVVAPREELKQTVACYLCYAALAMLLALPQLLIWTFPQTLNGGGLAVHFNWINNQGFGYLTDGYFWFWIKNVGLVYILMVPAALSLKKGSLARSLALGALVIYGVAELIRFQPNSYDNNKLFYVAFMVMMPIVALYLTELWEHLRGVRGRALLACVFMLVSVLSGTITLAREVVSDYLLFSADEVHAAEFIDAELPADAVFLTGTQHNNPVAVLAGRDIVCGSDSYLFYHGIDYSAQHNAEIQMLTDPANSADLFAEYGVDYVYISSSERFYHEADVDWFRENCELVFAEANVQIYAMNLEANVTTA